MVSTKLLTAQDLWKLGDRGDNYELIRGELVELTPPNRTHGRIMVNITLLLGAFVKERQLGQLYAGDVGFVFQHNPDTVLGPDLAFLTSRRIPKDDSTYSSTLPDLAIEIVSPSNAAREIERKIGIYLSSGVREVWIVYPGKAQVVVHSQAGPPRACLPGDHLTGGDILPGLSIEVSDIFDG